MYCAVIYCLIAVGYVGAVGPVYLKDREPRQANQQASSSPYPYVTYPDYSQKTLPPTVATAPTTVEIATQSSTSVTPTVTPTESSVLDSVKPYFRNFIQFSTKVSNYLLQALGLTFIGQSIVGLLCTYTSACKSLQEDSEQARQNIFIYFFF